VKVYAGIDRITKKRHYLTETIPPGPTARKDAEKARTRFLSQIDDRRNPRTRATVDQLLDRWLEVRRRDVDSAGLRQEAQPADAPGR
jgi:integrase